jgi:hypothetical protein
VPYAFNFPRVGATPSTAGLDLISSTPIGVQWPMKFNRAWAFKFKYVSGINGIPPTSNQLLQLVSNTIGILYGGIHLLAWNAPFHSKHEQILWRTSGILVTRTLVVLLFLFRGFINIVSCLLSGSRKGKERASPYQRSSVATWLGIILLWASVIVYAFARLYLVLECLISLPFVPAEVYVQPPWSRYIPHFGTG